MDFIKSGCENSWAEVQVDSFSFECRGYLEVPQTGQEATSTHKLVVKCLDNISETRFKCMCLNARSIVKEKQIVLKLENLKEAMKKICM